MKYMCVGAYPCLIVLLTTIKIKKQLAKHLPTFISSIFHEWAFQPGCLLGEKTYPSSSPSSIAAPVTVASSSSCSWSVGDCKEAHHLAQQDRHHLADQDPQHLDSPPSNCIMELCSEYFVESRLFIQSLSPNSAAWCFAMSSIQCSVFCSVNKC